MLIPGRTDMRDRAYCAPFLGFSRGRVDAYKRTESMKVTDIAHFPVKNWPRRTSGGDGPRIVLSLNVRRTR